MASTNFYSDTEGMSTKTKKVRAEYEEYVALTKSLYSIIENLSSDWVGVDGEEYRNNIVKQKPSIVNIGDRIEQVGLLIENHATSINDETATIASRFSA